MRHRHIIATVLLALASSWSVTAQEAAPVTLSGGASSLQETYQDWRVACQVVDNVTLCITSQQQVRQDGQRVLSVELSNGADNTLSGAIVLPFGLRLDAGITLQVDEGAIGEPRRFRTCLPIGCIASLTLDAATVSAMRAGQTLTLHTRGDDGQELAFPVSLRGIGAALDRLQALGVN
jgi:invasion protein IalB